MTRGREREGGGRGEEREGDGGREEVGGTVAERASQECSAHRQ